MTAPGTDRKSGAAAGREGVAGLNAFTVAYTIVFDGIHMTDDRQLFGDQNVELALGGEPGIPVPNTGLGPSLFNTTGEVSVKLAARGTT